MLDQFYGFTERLLLKFRLPISSWLFVKKSAIINAIDDRIGNLSISRGVFAGLLVISFIAVVSMDNNRWFDNNLIEPIEEIFASSVEEDYYLSTIYVEAGETYSFGLGEEETVTIICKSSGDVYRGIESTSWTSTVTDEISIWGTHEVEKHGLLYAPIAILLQIIMVLILSLTWIPFWNIIDFILRVSGKSEDERGDYWKDAKRVDGVIVFLLLITLGIVQVHDASSALDTILGLWQKALNLPAIALIILLSVNAFIGLIRFLKELNIQGIKDNQFASRVLNFLTQKTVQYIMVACLFACEFMPWWTAKGSASGYGYSSSSSASVSGFEIFPGWLSLLAIIATTIGIKNNSSWLKWSSLATTMACMLTLTIGSSSSSSSYGGAKASASMGPDIGFVLFLIISLVLFIPILIKSRLAKD